MAVRQQVESRDRTPLLAGGLLGLAGLGWWWTIQSSASMAGAGSMGMDHMGSMTTTLTLAGFFLAWVAMMAAMMFPAILPAVRLFERAAARKQAVATPIFVAGYLLVWSVVGLPVYFAWKALSDPLARGDHWAAHLVASVFAAAAKYRDRGRMVEEGRWTSMPAVKSGDGGVGDLLARGFCLTPTVCGIGPAGTSKGEE